MKKLIIIVLFSLFSVLARSEIQVQVEPGQVALGEQFLLTLIQENPQNGGVPDLTVLQKDFIILGTERTVNYSIINGQTQSTSQWLVSLKAKKMGTLTIPAIKIGMDQSAPVSLQVVQGAATQDVQVNSSKTQDVLLESSVNEKKVHVNQQVIYTVKLYNRKRLLDAVYQGPQVDDALLIPLGDAKRYQKTENSMSYVVEEQNYAIFPQKSGILKIKSPIFTALVYDFDSQRVKVQDKAISLNVQPIPEQYKGKIWLPAKQIKLTEQYENAQQTISQGSTVTRIVTIEGIGVPAQLLPTLNFGESDAFSVYTEKGKDSNQVKDGELVGSTEIKVTYLFNKPGRIVIPELKLPWFNTQTSNEEMALLAPRSMDITASAVIKPNTAAQQSIATDIAKTQSPQEIREISAQNNNWPWIIASIFALAWVLTLGLWGWQKRSGNLRKGKYKKALDALNKACKECNPAKTRDALLAWAVLYWPDAPILNLTDLAKLVKDAQLKKQLHLLSQSLYKNGHQEFWRGDELWRAVSMMSRTRLKVQRKASPLPPINPF